MQKRYCIKISRFLHRLEIAVVTQGERLTYRGQVLAAHKLRRGKRCEKDKPTKKRPKINRGAGIPPISFRTCSERIRDAYRGLR